MNKFTFKLPKPNRKQFLTIIFSLLGIIILGMSIYFGYLFIYNRNTKITSIIITNQTESSATIVWQTDNPVKGSIIVGGYKYYDSRDIEEIGLGEYELKNPEKRYTHYVTVPKLEAESEYEFQIKHDFVKTASDINNFKTASIAEEIKDPDPVYGYIFDGEGIEINDAVVLLYVEDGGEFSQPLAVYVSDNGSFTLDVGMVRSKDLSSQISLPEQYWENIYVWSRYGEIVRRVDSRYDRPIGGVGTEGDRLQYGKYTSSNNETSSIFNFSVSAGKDSPACSAGDSSVQVYGECCGNGKAREVRKCSDASTGVFYYKFSDCEHEASHCGGGGLDSKCNGNGIRDCEGYSTGNCESGVDCGNSVCGSCATQGGGGVPDHCKNGTKDDGLEEGTDCGGGCPACSSPSPASEKSDACPPGGCIATESVPEKTTIIQEDRGWEEEKKDIAQSPTRETLKCGESDLRSGCTGLFGAGGCNVSEGGACNWKNGWNNCVYGYTCSSGKCIKDTAVSSCWGTVAPTPRTVTGTYLKGHSEIIDSILSRPEYAGVSHPSIVRSGTGGCEWQGPTKIVCGSWMDTLNDQEKTAFWEHELTHAKQMQVRFNSETNPGSCPSKNDGYGSQSCGSRIREAGAESYSSGGNGGCYIFNTTEGPKCGTEVYNDVLQATGSREVTDNFFLADCNAYNQVNSSYNFCNNVTSYSINCAQNRQQCRNSTVQVGVSNDGTAKNEKMNFWEANFTISNVFAENTNVEEQGLYTVEVEGYEQSTKMVTLLPGDKVEIFNDINGDGIKQENEPVIENARINVSSSLHFLDYYFDEGWNSFAFPLYLMDDVGNEIKTAQQLLEYLQTAGIEVTQIAKYQDGSWTVATRRGKDNISDDFNLIPGDGYFIKSQRTYNLQLNGKKFEDAISIELQGGWNLISIYNPKKENYTAEELMKSMNEAGVQNDILTKWESGRYFSYIVVDAKTYGESFKMYPTQAYWVRIQNKEIIKYKPN